jgi:hypothetical protein
LNEYKRANRVEDYIILKNEIVEELCKNKWDILAKHMICEDKEKNGLDLQRFALSSNSSTDELKYFIILR